MDARKRETLRKSRTKTDAVTTEPNKNELDDPAVQEEILNPKPASLKVGGKEYIVHPLSAKHARRYGGLNGQICLEAVAGKTEVSGMYPLTSRMLNILLERYDEQFLKFLALATGEPGEIDEPQAEELARKFIDVIEDQELKDAFLILSTQNIKQEKASAKND